MAGTKISDLPELSSPTGNEEIPYAYQGANGKIKLSSIGGGGIFENWADGNYLSYGNISGASQGASIPNGAKIFYCYGITTNGYYISMGLFRIADVQLATNQSKWFYINGSGGTYISAFDIANGKLTCRSFPNGVSTIHIEFF